MSLSLPPHHERDGVAIEAEKHDKHNSCHNQRANIFAAGKLNFAIVSLVHSHSCDVAWIEDNSTYLALLRLINAIKLLHRQLVIRWKRA